MTDVGEREPLLASRHLISVICHPGRRSMLLRSVMGSIALVVAVIAGPAAAQQPFDENKYPPMAGQWQRVGPLAVFDSTKPPARGQQASLTAEDQARFEAKLGGPDKGGPGSG